MRIYLNRRPIVGPWGGGNRFVSELVTQLKACDHHVTYDIKDRCDRYVCFDPRPNSDGVTIDTFKKLYREHGYGSIICRVGDLGTHGKPEIANMWKELLGYAAKIVFPSGWSRDYCCDVVMRSESSHVENVGIVIANGADKRFVDAHRSRSYVRGCRFDVVTHHWSDNPMKGFDVYAHVDAVADDSMRFKYIGRAPSWCRFRNAVPPCDVDGLIAQMNTADVYLTASKFEAGANHVLEAMALGLPIVYPRDGGSIVEYCEGYGVQYDGTGPGAVAALEQCWMLSSMFSRYTRTTSDAVREFIEVITR